MQRNNTAFKKNDVAIASRIICTKMKDTQDTLGKKKCGAGKNVYYNDMCI